MCILDLHSLWVGLLIAQRIRTLPNYTMPLPTSPTPSTPPSVIVRNRQIEAALHGAIYDPYVRWIVLEGIYGWWSDDLEEWTTCPKSSAMTKPAVSPVPATSFGGLVEPQGDGILGMLKALLSGQSVMSTEDQVAPPFEDPEDVPVCPYHWAAPIHELNCAFIWPANLTSPHDPEHPGPTPVKVRKKFVHL